MKVAVIGAGLFGITAALELDEAGHKVTLFERKPQILQAASGINQYRLHRGYHYPRSAETIKACLAAEDSFREMFGAALIEDLEHYYCIAKEGSKTSAERFRQVCDKYGLHYKEEDSGVVDNSKLEATFRVKEYLIDPFALLEVCLGKLKESNVDLKTNSEVFAHTLKGFDHIVVATYAKMNETLGKEEHSIHSQFEVCEKPVLKLPQKFANKSIVIIDGPFMCIDPFGRTGNHVMGNVVHAIHATNVGKHHVTPEELKHLLNEGVVKNPKVTAFKKFINAAKEFFPGIEKAKHIGSMYTVRAVLPNVDATDERPTLVRKVDSKTTSVFSGKLVNSVLAAREIVDALKNQ